MFENMYEEEELDDNQDDMQDDYEETVFRIDANIDDTIENEQEIAQHLAILPLRNTVLFPKVVVPIVTARENTLKLIKDIYQNKKNLGCVAQIHYKIENPNITELYKFGTIGQIVKLFETPNNSKTAIIQGIKRFKILELTQEIPYIIAKVEFLKDILPPDNDKEFEAIIDNLKERSIKIVELSDNIPDGAIHGIKNIDNYSFFVNFISSNSNLGVENKQTLLEIDDLKVRAFKLLEFLNIEVKKLELKYNINNKVNKELDKQNKEYYLNQQIKAIQEELGDGEKLEIEELMEKSKKIKWTQEAKNAFEKELKRLRRIHPASPDYSIQLTYLQNITDLPWNTFTKDNFDLTRAEKILDKKHYALDTVKDRILEYISVLKLKGNLKSPIICLYGPPGVGKTSLGKSIAKALKRKFTRMSLGGLHDEAEIRGHRKTYIGAMPGRIIQNILKIKSANPVFVLDEIDKVGNDFRGDPSSALLEVLDPEQNNKFYDNYLEVEFDLSNVMFIATANQLSTISPALLDRMELINVTGYIVEEKIEITKRHLIPQQLKDHGVKNDQVIFTDTIIEYLIDKYTRESGVRSINKVIASLIRKVAKNIAFGKEYNKELNTEDITTYLGSPKFLRSKYMGNRIAGLVTGLAWTAAGGEIISIESSINHGNGKLSLTGNLGNVMKESALIALEYIKSHANILQLNPAIFNHWNIHLHVPEGAVPKDGPSAGITMALSIASVFSQRKVRENVAMTGEITLSGMVLPVGGIKEKILAAKRAGITDIIISSENRADIDEIKDIYKTGVNFHYVENIEQVFQIALLTEKVENKLNVTIPKTKQKRKTKK